MPNEFYYLDVDDWHVTVARVFGEWNWAVVKHLRGTAKINRAESGFAAMKAAVAEYERLTGKTVTKEKWMQEIYG